MIIFSHRFPIPRRIHSHPHYPPTPLRHLLRHLDDKETDRTLRADLFTHSCTTFHEAFAHPLANL